MVDNNLLYIADHAVHLVHTVNIVKIILGNELCCMHTLKFCGLSPDLWNDLQDEPHQKGVDRQATQEW